jgi:hypothetical protein
MANPTTNYGFVLPTSSDLVTDLPADFDVALQGVDTRLKALQPGTTLGDLAYSSATANTNTRLAVGSTGQVLTVAAGVPSWATPAATTPTFVGCYLENSSNFSLPSAVNTAVTWSTEIFDTDGFHSTSSNTSRITIPAGKAGKYLFTFAGFYENGGVSNSPRIRFQKNGTVFLSVQESAQFQMAFVLSTIVDLAVSDYVEVYLFHNSGGSAGTLYSGVESNFTATFLGA